MKGENENEKNRNIIASLIMLLCAVFVLAACGNKDNAKLPSSNYEKVQFAFNGVESSLKNSNSSKKLKSNYASTDSKMLAISYGVPLLKLMANSVNSDDISTIYNAMSVEKETSNPSFEYDEPPMIQFQYLKTLYEKRRNKKMTKRKSIFTIMFSFVLMLCLLVLPAMFLLSSCENSNPEKKENAITINVSSKIYDGQAINVVATSTSGDVVDLAYKISTDPDEEAYYFIEAPKNAGTYTVLAGVKETEKYNHVAEQCTFTIYPKEVGILWSEPNSFVYDGIAKIPTATAIGLVGSDECSVNVVLTEGQNNVNVGSFTFTANGLTNSNYKLPTNVVSNNYVITKANPQYVVPSNLTATYGETLSNVSLPTGFSWVEETSTSVGDYGNNTFHVNYTPSDTDNYNVVSNIEVVVVVTKISPNLVITNSENLSKNYDGEAVTSPSYTKNGDGAVSVLYKLKTESDDTYSNVEPVSAGNYVVKVSVEETQKYSAQAVMCEFTISKATPEYDAPTGLIASYGQTLANVELPAGFTWVEDLTTSVGNAGTNTFHVTFTPQDTTNYNVVEGIEVEIEVLKQSPGLEITNKDSLSKIYNNEPIVEPTYIRNGDGVVSIDYKIKSPDDETYSTEKPVIAGTYILRAKVLESANYTEQIITFEFTISKATPEYDAPTGLIASYGQTLANVELPAGFTWVEDLTTSVGNAGTNTFHVTFTPQDTTNYNVVEGIEVEIEVLKQSPELEIINAESLAKVYDNEPIITPEYTRSGNGAVVIEYKVQGYSDETYSTNKPVNAGNYVVRIKVNETEIYEQQIVTYEFTISKATPEYVAPTGLTAGYGDRLYEIELPEHFTWYEDTYTTVGNIGENTFHVVYNPEDTTNYITVYPIEVTVTVEKSYPKFEIPVVTYHEGITLADVPLQEGWARHYNNDDQYPIYHTSLNDRRWLSLDFAETANNYGYSNVQRPFLVCEFYLDKEATQNGAVKLLGDTSTRYGVTYYVGMTNFATYAQVKVYYKLQGADNSTYTEELPTTPGTYIVKMTITITREALADFIADMNDVAHDGVNSKNVTFPESLEIEAPATCTLTLSEGTTYIYQNQEEEYTLKFITLAGNWWCYRYDGLHDVAELAELEPTEEYIAVPSWADPNVVAVFDEEDNRIGLFELIDGVLAPYDTGTVCYTYATQGEGYELYSFNTRNGQNIVVMYYGDSEENLDFDPADPYSDWIYDETTHILSYRYYDNENEAWVVDTQFVVDGNGTLRFNVGEVQYVYICNLGDELEPTYEAWSFNIVGGEYRVYFYLGVEDPSDIAAILATEPEMYAYDIWEPDLENDQIICAPGSEMQFAISLDDENLTAILPTPTTEEV